MSSNGISNCSAICLGANPSLNKSNALIEVGGGDTVLAVNSYSKKNNIIISTGGGASLEYLEGKKLPGVIYEKEKK